MSSGGPDDSADLHGLRPEDWCLGGCYGDSITVRAARNPDPAILRTILEHGHRNYPQSQYLAEGNEHGPNAVNPPDVPGYTSALLQVIISQFPENVTTLLNAGANPNGFSRSSLSHNAAGFLRFGPHFAERQNYRMEDSSVFNREHLITYIDVQQLEPLTQEEVEQRFRCPIASRFWTEVRYRTFSPVENSDLIPALLAAAENPDVDILKSLLDAPGTDTSFWTSNPHAPNMPSPAMPSSLAISAPLHAAIRGRNQPALSLLLSHDFNPNVLPLAAPAHCITPAMATIVCCDPWNIDAYKTLREHSLLDLRIRTPVYNVSLVHFAVARLDMSILKTVTTDVSLSVAGRTALGHNLLHIACLPLDESWVQMHSLPIFTSCRETRNLSELEIVSEGAGDYLHARKILKERKSRVPKFSGLRGRKRSARFSTRPTREAVRDCHRRQMEIVGFLLDNCKSLDVAAMDIHGNTPMHYLASHRDINEELLDILWKEEYAEEAWRMIENRYGFTAAILFCSGYNVVEEEKHWWNVIDVWEEKQQNEKEIWEEKFRSASHAVVQRALLRPDSN
ncbi:MAG: hypothetical protein Q9169_004589 [Polycauliona sp. 2 TL-2023]